VTAPIRMAARASQNHVVTQSLLIRRPHELHDRNRFGRVHRPPVPVIRRDEGKTPSRPGRISPDAARIFAEIDAHVLQVAKSSPAGADVRELAYAIHNLITGIEKLHER
jgi:hypothetical protein